MRRTRKTHDKAFKVMIGIGCLALLVKLGILAVVGYTIYHFINKYW